MLYRRLYINEDLINNPVIFTPYSQRSKRIYILQLNNEICIYKDKDSFIYNGIVYYQCAIFDNNYLKIISDPRSFHVCGKNYFKNGDHTMHELIYMNKMNLSRTNKKLIIHHIGNTFDNRECNLYPICAKK